MNKIDLAQLSKLEPLSKLSRDNLRDLLEKSRLQELAKGKMLFKAGAATNSKVYLLTGEVEFYDANNNSVSKISADSKAALQPLSSQKSPTYSCRSLSQALVLYIDGSLLDVMLTWNEQAHAFDVGVVTEADGQENWMSQILSCKAFYQVPPANIQALFLYMEEIEATPGEKIIEQGAEGDYFYVIKSGKALVTRSGDSANSNIKLAELGAGDSFGEEALIASTLRNATVTMLQRGKLMRLSKENFLHLLQEPMLQKITREEGDKLVADKKAKWLDVRLPNEYQSSHLQGAENTPLIALRIKCDSMDKNIHWLVYSNDEHRSSAAAYLLAERGFEVSLLQDGYAAASSATS